MSKQTGSIFDMVGSVLGMGIGLMILSKIMKAANTPRTVYRLKKIIKALEAELITKTLIINEEIIRP